MRRWLRWIALGGALLWVLAPGPTEAGNKPSKPKQFGAHPTAQGAPGGPVAPATSQSVRVARVVASTHRLSVRIHAAGAGVTPPQASSTPTLTLHGYRAARDAVRAAPPSEPAIGQARALRRRSTGVGGVRPPSRETVQAWASIASVSGGGVGAEMGVSAVPAKPGRPASGVYDLSHAQARAASKRAAAPPAAVASTARARGLVEDPGAQAPTNVEPLPGHTPVAVASSIDGFVVPAHRARPADATRLENDWRTDDVVAAVRIQFLQAQIRRLVVRRALEEVRADLGEPAMREDRLARFAEPLRVMHQSLEAQVADLRLRRSELQDRIYTLYIWKAATDPMEK